MQFFENKKLHVISHWWKYVTIWRKEQQKLKSLKKKLKMYIIYFRLKALNCASGNINNSIFNYNF